MSRTERHEYKYVLTPGDAVRLKSRLDRLLLRDPHSDAKPYLVRSLYFDTPDNVDFHMKMSGTLDRRKFRLRTYGRDNAFFRMEEKQKFGDLQTKLSLPVTPGEAASYIRADFAPLLSHTASGRGPDPRSRQRTGIVHGSEAEAEDHALSLYRSLMLGVYRPVVRIEYSRTAYTAEAGGVRITFDEDIRSSESDLDLFRNDSAHLPVMPGKCVLEVKFGRMLPGWIPDVLKPFHLTRTSFSKYAMSRPVFYLFD